jgi:uncharacterized membrane-anchored protein YhcB (DUF1043 family)
MGARIDWVVLFVAVVLGLAIGYLLFMSGDEDVATLVVNNPSDCA